MDLFGPWPVTEQSNQYVCVLTDLFSKFAVAQTIPNKEAASVAKVVVSLCTTYNGAPQRILTVQGGEFNNKGRIYYIITYLKRDYKPFIYIGSIICYFTIIVLFYAHGYNLSKICMPP